MLRTSTIALHPQAGAIDHAIAVGDSLADIARQHGVTTWAVARRRNALRRDHPEYLAAIAASRSIT